MANFLEKISGFRSLYDNKEIVVEFERGNPVWLVCFDVDSLGSVQEFLGAVEYFQYQCRIVGIAFKNEEKIKELIEEGEISIDVVRLENNDKKIFMEELKIERIPWFIGFDETDIIYSMETVPGSFPVIESQSPQLPSESQFIPEIPLIRDSAQSLNKSWISQSPKHEKQPNIEEFKEKIFTLERINEDYKMEIASLKAKLQAKDDKINQLQVMLESIPTYGTNKTKIQKIKKINEITSFPQEDIDFWKSTDEIDNHNGAVKFEEIAATKDLWIMNIDRSSNVKSSQPSIKNSTPSSPLQKPRPTASRDAALKNLKYAQEKFIKKQSEKNPIGRDGKRLPIIINRSSSLKRTMTRRTNENENIRRSYENNF
ncbi:unnamed protein product [Blepharisma stoltei]|uniref:Uncharacterized protein n=1 Tax=Blepharisma stoltei TaxID=1481888 RepID=A0AAU9J0H0_9CILI|nr:unnamed protein product [Blepharisma stoltei]